MERYLKRENESNIEYLIRLCGIKLEEKPDDLDWADIVRLCGLDCHYDSLRKAMQPEIYGAYAIYKYFIDKQVSNDDVVKQLEIAQRELFKERQKLRDEKNEYHAWLREQARMELFFERIDEAVDRLLIAKPRKIPEPIEIQNKDVEIICGFADPHYGVNFKIKGFFDDIINEYNPNIFKQRMWILRDELLQFCGIHNCKHVHIVDLGDSIEGILHLSQLKALHGNIVDDIMDYADFIADWLENISQYLFIDFYTSEGNHSDLRLLTGQKQDFPHENLERIYSRFLQKVLKNNPNIRIHCSLSGLNYFNVNGYNFLTVHGNNEKNIRDSIKEYEDFYNIKINYMLVGHLHSKNEIEISKGKEVVQVRSLMGVNEHSAHLKKASDAGAIMFTVHQDYGKKYINEVKFK